MRTDPSMCSLSPPAYTRESLILVACQGSVMSMMPAGKGVLSKHSAWTELWTAWLQGPDHEGLFRAQL